MINQIRAYQAKGEVKDKFPFSQISWLVYLRNEVVPSLI